MPVSSPRSEATLGVLPSPRLRRYSPRWEERREDRFLPQERSDVGGGGAVGDGGGSLLSPELEVGEELAGSLGVSGENPSQVALPGLTKYRYEIDLRRTLPDEVVEGVRAVSPDDLEALAHLMLESYRGTIDYEGEELDDAIDEVRSFFEDDPMLAHSFGVVVNGTIVSAVLVSAVDDAPFISYVMTMPEHKNQGWARRVAAAALRSLADAGHERVVFYITDGNLASEALFRSLGARRVEEE